MACDNNERGYGRMGRWLEALKSSFVTRIRSRNRTAPGMKENNEYERRPLRPLLLALVCLAIIAVLSLSGEKGHEPRQVGWVERVALCPGGCVIPAKIDTGAVSCSLHCPNPTMYEKDGNQWVRFEIKDADGKDVTIDRPVVGMRRIKRHFGDYQERPVIKMGVCLGSLFRETDVNLVDRTGFEYPMLIGRSFMDQEIVVNPSVKHTVEPVCRVEQ
jgi:hypothetical protein